MKVLLQKKKKSPTLDYMRSISSSIATMSSSRRSYAFNLTQFATNLISLTHAVCPTAEQSIIEIKSIYDKIVSNNTKLADSELRSSEDIRDLIERFAVVERVNEEYIAQKDAYENSSNKLISALADELAEKDKPGYEKNRIKIEAAIIKAKTEKNSNNKILRERIQDLVNTKEKYNAFKKRRLVSAWTTFAGGLHEYAEKEAELFKELTDALDRLRNDDAPVEVVNAIAEAGLSPNANEENAVGDKLNELNAEAE